MRKIFIYFFVFLCSFCLSTESFAHPLKNSPSPKWRIAYVEGGPYSEYQSTFMAILKGFMQQNMLKKTALPPVNSFADSREIWNWAVQNTQSDIIEFIPDGFYSANWDSEQRIEQKKTVLKRINEQNDIDIILAFGTFGGSDFATDEHDVPTFVMSVTDYVQAKIIVSPQDSGRDHVHASVETGRYERQLATFFDVFHFKKLGIPFDDSEDGKATIALTQLENAAKKLGFEIELCGFNTLESKDKVVDNLISCLEDLGRRSDAIYMTMNTAMQRDRMTDILEPVINAGLPTFSQLGVDETELGVLMSLSQPSFDNEGLNTVNAIIETINGKLPRECEQEYSGPLGLAINLKMAMLIGWNPPFEILAAVDNIFHEIRNDTK